MKTSLNDSKLQDGRVVTVLQNIVRKQLNVKALIQDIQDTVEDEKDLERFHQQVQKTMKDISTLLEEMESLAKEQDQEKDKEAVLADVCEHRNQLASLRQMLRKANFVAQATIERSSRTNLLESTTKEGTIHLASVRQRVIHKDKDNLSKMSSNVTNDLLSISRTLASQVKQSEDALQTLVQSSTVASETQEEFKAMGGVIHQSRKLLSKYNRREFTDKVLIFLALAFFFACVLYVMTKRAF